MYAADIEAIEPKLEDSDYERGLENAADTQDDQEVGQEVEDRSQVDEEMEDLFGDDKDVEEVKHEGFVISHPQLHDVKPRHYLLQRSHANVLRTCRRHLLSGEKTQSGYGIR